MKTEDAKSLAWLEDEIKFLKTKIEEYDVLKTRLSMCYKERDVIYDRNNIPTT